MHFCEKCSNMYYISLKENDNNKLIYYCRNCGNTDDKLLKDNLCILKSEVYDTKTQFKNIINKYTKFDPTLPRINTIKCPNSECISNKDKSTSEIIYLRYNDIDMKYVYLCCNCDYYWTTST